MKVLLFILLLAPAFITVGVYATSVNGGGVFPTAGDPLPIESVDGGLPISKGDVPGASYVHKFGYAPDFDTADNEVTIWDAAEDDQDWENMRYDYSSTADIDSISSSSASDTQTITVEGLDSSTNFASTTATLSGTNRVALSTNLYRVFRAYNTASTSIAGHVFVYPNTALTDGVPTDTSKIRIVIDPANNQTEMAVYTVPAGKTAYLRSFDVATSGASRSSSYIMRLYTRIPGGVFRLQKRMAIDDAGSSAFQYSYVEPPVYAAGTDIEMTIQMTVTSGTAGSVSGGFDLVLVDN